EKGVVVCRIALEAGTGVGVCRYARIGRFSCHDIDGPGEAVDSVDTCSGPADDFYTLNGIGRDGQVQAIVACLGIQYFDAIDEDEGLFKTPTIDTNIGLRAEGPALANINTAHMT